MPLIEGEGKDWNETEVELDRALCNFCNNASDPYPNVDKWDASVRRDFATLCKAYNNWYSWRIKKSEEARTD